MSLDFPDRTPVPDRIVRGYKLRRTDLEEMLEDRDAHAEDAAQVAHDEAVAQVPALADAAVGVQIDAVASAAALQAIAARDAAIEAAELDAEAKAAAAQAAAISAAASDATSKANAAEATAAAAVAAEAAARASAMEVVESKADDALTAAGQIDAVADAKASAAQTAAITAAATDATSKANTAREAAEATALAAVSAESSARTTALATLDAKVVPGPSRIEAWGHSGFANDYDGASGFDWRAPDRLAALTGSSVRNHAVMGACLTIDEDSTVAGGYARILQRSGADRQVNADGIYAPGAEVVALWYGWNEYNLAPVLADVDAAFRKSLRVAISRARASAIFEDSHSSWVYGSGAWFDQPETRYNSGSGFRKSTAATATATINVPAHFPGGTIAVGSFSAKGATSTYSFSVDGGAAQVLSAAQACPVDGFAGGLVHRITGLAPGAHTIAITATKGTTPLNAVFLDYWQVEAPAATAPLVMIVKQPAIANGAAGVQNWADDRRAAMNASIDAVIAEFDSRVVAVSLDAALNNPAATVAGVDPTMFRDDKLHPSPKGHAAIAGAMLAAMKLAGVPANPVAVGRRRLAARAVANVSAVGTIKGRLEVAMPDGTIGYVPVYAS